jgi:four helix bundle suffix protein
MWTWWTRAVVHAVHPVHGALLGRQLAAQARAFERQGGFTERLYRKRQERRGRG